MQKCVSSLDEFNSQRSNEVKTIGDYSYSEKDELQNYGDHMVYKGINLITNQKVVIRVFLNTLNEATMQKLSNEINVLTQLRNNHIQKLYEVYHAANKAYIITQLFDKTLKAVIKQKKTKQDQGFIYLVQIVNGYTKMREKGYLHRNLSPQTIFLKSNIIKLGQLHKCFDEIHYEDRLEMQLNCKSYFYQAPEVLMRNQYSQKSDIWSLGIIFYEMLFQEVPYQGKTIKDHIQQIKNKSFPNWDSKDLIWKIIKGCLGYSPEKRFNLFQLKQAIFKNQNVQFEKLPLFNESDKTQKLSYENQNKYSIILNQQNYIFFLSKAKELLKNSKPLPFSGNLEFLLSYMIKIRIKCLLKIKLNQNLGKKCELQKTTPNLQSLKIQETIEKYDLNLQYFNEPPEKRLQYFKKMNFYFQESLILQYQALIKQYIQQLYNFLHFIRTEQHVIQNKFQILLFDFLITAFQLNSLVIEFSNDHQLFAQNSLLSQIVQAPFVVDLCVFELIRQKYKDLQF